MFFSVNNEHFASRHPKLVKFVLDCGARTLPAEYKLDLVLVRGAFARSLGVFGRGNTETGSWEVGTEIAHYPFALQLMIGEVFGERRGALEHFAELEPDDEREVWLYTVAGHIATKYPGDYRSRERVQREAAVAVTDEPEN